MPANHILWKLGGLIGQADAEHRLGAPKVIGDLFRTSKKSILGVSVLDLTRNTYKIRVTA